MWLTGFYDCLRATLLSVLDDAHNPGSHDVVHTARHDVMIDAANSTEDDVINGGINDAVDDGPFACFYDVLVDAAIDA